MSSTPPGQTPPNHGTARPHRVIGLFIASGFVLPVLGVLAAHLVRYRWSVPLDGGRWGLAVTGTLALAALSFLVWSDCGEYTSALSRARRLRIRIRL